MIQAKNKLYLFDFDDNNNNKNCFLIVHHTMRKHIDDTAKCKQR